MSLLPAVVFVACHGGPADHFATFTQGLLQEGCSVQVHATGAALTKFTDRNVVQAKPFSLLSDDEDQVAIKIAKAHTKATAVITDVGHPFAAKIQKAFTQYAPKVRRLAYYDNPEKYVPGYSETAATVMPLAEKVLFANEKLIKEELLSAPGTKIDLSSNHPRGIGYYPVAQAEALFLRRQSEHETARAALLEKLAFPDQGQKVLVYFGGNNELYFSKAFPSFLDFLKQAMTKSDLSKYLIVLQQHPSAKEKNLDGIKLQEWLKECGEAAAAPKIVISDFDSTKAQIIADGALYYQTSMGPQFVIAAIPTVQVAHETYDDLLVRNKLCQTVTNKNELIIAFDKLPPFSREAPAQAAIFSGLGIRTDWLALLKKVVIEMQVEQALDALKSNLARPIFSRQVSKLMRQGGPVAIVSAMSHANKAGDKFLQLACSSIAKLVLKRSSAEQISAFRSYVTSELQAPQHSIVRYECEQLAN